MINSQTDQKSWDNFVFQSNYGSFLQSWAWGEMQKELGISFWRLVEEEQGRISAVALVIKRELPIGRSWLYVSRGPISVGATFMAPGLQEKLISLAYEQKAIFVRIDPAYTEASAGKPVRWRKADHEVQPKRTIILDLNKSNEELLAAMHPKTRYNINLARKRGVTIRWAADEAAVDVFWQLAQAVMSRGDFRYHPLPYYQAMVKILGRAGLATVGIAEQAGVPLAAHIIITAGRVATYVHGASSSIQRQLMAPYLLHWQTIERARQAGARSYDLFGIGPQWPGITRFKEGFGGTKIEYLGAYDLVVDSGLYSMLNLARKIRTFMQ